MNNDSFRDIDIRRSKEHISSFSTFFGVRSFYSSVSFCNRCGSCAQNCPTYLFSQEEPLSPRGRNQAARLLLEQKLVSEKNIKELLRLVNSCTLCGRCTHYCAGKTPTPQHVLEIRRLLGKRVLPFTLQKIMEMRFSHPQLFNFLLKTGIFLRKFGFVKLARFSGLTTLTGFGWLGKADTLLPGKIPSKKRIAAEKEPTLIYIPSLETVYFQPSVYQNTLALVFPLFRTAVWENVPTGRFEYVFGNIRKARVQIKQLITRHAQLPTENTPILTDSIDTYIFLKECSPSLFAGYPKFQKKAEKFAACVRFITDFLPSKKDIPEVNTPVYLDKGALFSCEAKPQEDTEKQLRSYFSENFVQFTYDADMPAFAYSFVMKNNSPQLLPFVLQPVKEKQIKTIITLSGWNKMEWERAVKKIDRNIRVLHICELNR